MELIHQKETIDKYQVGTTIFYVIGANKAFPIVVTMRSSGAKVEILTQKELAKKLEIWH